MDPQARSYPRSAVVLGIASLVLLGAVSQPIGLYQGPILDLGLVQIGYWGLANAGAAILPLAAAVMSLRPAALVAALCAGAAAYVATLEPLVDSQGPGLLMVAYPCCVVAMAKSGLLAIEFVQTAQHASR